MARLQLPELERLLHNSLHDPVELQRAVQQVKRLIEDKDLSDLTTDDTRKWIGTLLLNVKVFSIDRQELIPELDNIASRMQSDLSISAAGESGGSEPMVRGRRSRNQTVVCSKATPTTFPSADGSSNTSTTPSPSHPTSPPSSATDPSPVKSSDKRSPISDDAQTTHQFSESISEEISERWEIV